MTSGDGGGEGGVGVVRSGGDVEVAVVEVEGESGGVGGASWVTVGLLPQQKWEKILVESTAA